MVTREEIVKDFANEKYDEVIDKIKIFTGYNSMEICMCFELHALKDSFFAEFRSLKARLKENRLHK